MVEVVAERGFAGASVGLVVSRARVSRRTFEGQFGGLEECLGSVLDLGRERAVELVSDAFAGQKTWQDGVRMALASLLVFLDSDPLLARVWVVESLAAGTWALEHRERNISAVRELVLSSWPPSAEWSVPPLAAEGALASVLGIVHAHIVAGKREPLIELLGPLMGLVAAPYLGARGVRREIARGDELARAIQAEDPSWAPTRAAVLVTTGQGTALPATLENPRARRARACLLRLAERPDSSNRELAAGIGVAHEPQMSTLLAYLLHENLVTKRSEGKGKRNAWRLTPRGQEIARVLSVQRDSHRGSLHQNTGSSGQNSRPLTL
jgi:AcrR family transcriptional regulator